ncbi:MAG: hypothetical protein AAGD13_10175 [Pseudomonadota bacterium]
MTSRRITGTIAASAIAAALSFGQAHACDTVHYLTFDVEDGGFIVRLNGTEAFDHDKGYAQGSLTLRGGLVAGENTVEIEYVDGGSGEAAEFAILQGCEGAFPDETPIAEASASATGTHNLVFSSAAANTALPSTDAYEVTDGQGVVEALHRLQTAVEAGDMDTVFALHAPFFAKIEALGAPMDRVRAMIAHSVERGELTKDANPSVTSRDGGTVFELRSAAGEPPISLIEKVDNGYNAWTTGTKWVRIDGTWGVIDLD